MSVIKKQKKESEVSVVRHVNLGAASSVPSHSLPQVRYISLKPLSKKERKRQARGVQLLQQQDLGGGDGRDGPFGQVPGDDDETFHPRSPVPLPDASTCKPILVQLGRFAGTEKTKKGAVKEAHGIQIGRLQKVSCSSFQ